eukprot:gnl/MRDRNA2_/MRDRNA2_84847_c0_seq1.p1 gnl/MRDRNA2_/MRDRNA2_84847_c0~~gnl/MRDRNA2_/MRDRNA2_84847_c0_seq1.p1  ORF type:complete len:143 (+),score=4.77 gnl/MRDRNA2_/MRDRNA2_84847_c0_seq1:246-674(+)
MKQLRILTIVRNLNVNEVKLTLDVKEIQMNKTRITTQTQLLNDSSQNALPDLVNGNTPPDRYAAQKLSEYFANWPLQQTRFNTGKRETITSASMITEMPVQTTLTSSQLIGYSPVFIISAIPVFIALITTTILFLNSVKTVL